MIKVLVVDDQEIVRKGVISLLEDVKDIEIIAEASSGEEAVSLAQKHHPHVVLMDIQMPGIGGLEATKKILRFDPKIKILVLTGSDSETYVDQFLDEGASGYLTKSSGLNELLTSIHDLFNGKHYIDKEMAQKMAFRGHGKNVDSSPFSSLSKRELEIVMMIVEKKRSGDISKLLHLDNKTINTYRYRIFSKLKIKTDVELVYLAIENKLIDPR